MATTPPVTPQQAPQQTLSQLVRAKYPGAYDDMDDSTLEQGVLAKHPEYSDLPRSQAQGFSGQAMASAPQGNTSLNAAPKAFTLPWFKQELTNFEEGATKNLPAIGATIGGMAGAPAGGPVGAVGGAGIGGMGGAAASQILRRILFGEGPQTSSDAAKDITKQGVTQAGIQGVTEGLPFLAGPLKKAATTQYERALAPTTKINKAITQDIAPEMMQRGVKGSLEGMEQKAGQKIAELNPQLNTQYGQLQGAGKIPGSGDQVISDLENLKQSYMPEGNVAQPQAVNAIEGIQGIVKQYGSDISPNSLRRLRQIFEEVPAQRGAYAGADLSTNYTLNAQQEAADSIRGILNKNPDIGALNKEISFWLDVQRVTRDSGLRRTGQEGGLLKVLGPLGAAIAGGGTGVATHSTAEGLGAASATMLATAAVQISRTPWWRTTTAVAKNRVANALASGDVGQISALLSRLGIAATGTNSRGTQTSPSANPQ